MAPTYCRVCDVDLGVNKKNWRSISGNSCCSVLTNIARSSLEASSSESSLDVKKFEEGYLCRGCLKIIEKLHKLQSQVNELTIQVTEKLSPSVHLFRSTAAAQCIVFPAQNTPGESLASQSSRKQSISAIDIHADPEHRKKRRRDLRNIESIPVSSSSKQSDSPDVAVSDSC
jgi:nucleotidyltransferase/DNA polymerase involved in DNA repair